MSKRKTKPVQPDESFEGKCFRHMLASGHPEGFTFARKQPEGDYLAFSVYDGRWHRKGDPGCDPVEV